MNNSKHSSKRDAIYEIISSTKSHPGAEWVYSQLKSKIPDLSLATVYRNIARFRESGEIVCVAVVGGQERYDADVSEHVHFICTSCNAVLDIDSLPLSEETVREIEEKHGVCVHKNCLNLIGLCDKCNTNPPLKSF